MKPFKLVTKLGTGGMQVGIHWLGVLPRVGDHIIGEDSTLWRIDAVAHYSFLREHQFEGPVGELAVTKA